MSILMCCDHCNKHLLSILNSVLFTSDLTENDCYRVGDSSPRYHIVGYTELVPTATSIVGVGYKDLKSFGKMVTFERAV